MQENIGTPEAASPSPAAAAAPNPDQRVFNPAAQPELISFTHYVLRIVAASLVLGIAGIVVVGTLLSKPIVDFALTKYPRFCVQTAKPLREVPVAGVLYGLVFKSCDGRYEPPSSTAIMEETLEKLNLMIKEKKEKAGK